MNKNNDFDRNKNYDSNFEFSEMLLLGTIKKEKGLYIFVPTKSPDDSYVLPATKQVVEAENKRVCCKLEEKSNGFIASLDKVFGAIDDPISENIAIAYKYGFKKEFSNEVMNEVDNIPQQVTEKEIASRVDMRDKYFMPWDPATCRDKDDAIYAEKTDNGYKIFVAIADVSHYVKMGTEIDKEAFKRGTSCYLGSGVYPMLPPELSNGICSLNDNVDRLALVSEIDIDKKGNIVSYDFHKAVINIKQSFSYENAEKVHLCQDGFDKKYEESKKYVDLMYEITDVLENKLINRGKVDFYSNEPCYTFNKEKNIVEDINLDNQERSHKVVEQFMVLANEATAKFFKDNRIDGIYRGHSNADDKKLTELNLLLKKYNVNSFVFNDPKSFQKLMKEIENHPARDLLNDIAQRTMKKAKYTNMLSTHFGLASDGYTHFTSPIRRYADTIAHRIISQYIYSKKSFIKSKNIEKIAEHINYQEKQATMAERQSDSYLACLWAQNHQNEIFNATVTRILPVGLGVKYKTIKMIVPFSALPNANDGSYVLSKDSLSVKHNKTNNRISLGDKLPLKIGKVDISNYVIFATTDLENIDEQIQ